MLDSQQINFQQWGQLCDSAQKTLTPLSALKTAVPEFYNLLADTSARFGVSFDSTSVAASNLEETRIPIRQATLAVISASENVGEIQKSYLESAIKWLESPHPMQGSDTKHKMESLLSDVKHCISGKADLTALARKLKGGE